jgi:hypothetical protein
MSTAIIPIRFDLTGARALRIGVIASREFTLPWDTSGCEYFCSFMKDGIEYIQSVTLDEPTDTITLNYDLTVLVAGTYTYDIKQKDITTEVKTIIYGGVEIVGSSTVTL